MKVFALIASLLIGLVTPLAIMPSPQGTHWYAGETIYLRVVSNNANDGDSYNLYLKQGSIKEKIYSGAPYNIPISFVVPDAFNRNGCGTLYAVAVNSSVTYDTMQVQLMSLYDYNQFYNGNSGFNRYGYDTDSGSGYIGADSAYNYNTWGGIGGTGSGGCSGCAI